jgi:hypothetical protein
VALLTMELARVRTLVDDLMTLIDEVDDDD